MAVDQQSEEQEGTLALMDLPRGQPVALAPKKAGTSQRALSVNPFWSSRAQDEATIRSLRPQSLPNVEVPSVASRTQPLVEEPSELRDLLTMIYRQNTAEERTGRLARTGWSGQM